MTCNFFSPSHMNPHAHTSCLPAFPAAYTACMPAHAPCTPKPAFHSFHNNYNACGHHHSAGNALALNMCTPCCSQSEAKKSPLDLSKLAITINPTTGEILEASSKNPTGQNMQRCMDIIKHLKMTLKLAQRVN